MSWKKLLKNRDDCLCWRTKSEREMMMDDDGNCKHCGRKIPGMEKAIEWVQG